MFTCFITCAYGQTPGADALVAAYSFDEGVDTSVADSSGNLHTGALTNTTWSNAGRFGSALSFNGSNSWVTVNDSALLDLTNGMTLQAWVSPTALSGWRTAVMKERPGGLGYALYAHDNAPRPASYINVGSGDIGAIGASQLPLNTWTHIATTYDGTTLKMYVNGALAGSQAVSGSILTSTSPLRIGGNSIWGEYFSGLIDEVRVHNRALSQSEIQELMLLPVSEAAGFEILAYNDTVTLGASDSGIFQMDLIPLGGFTGAVTPSVSGLPQGITGTFEPVGGPPHPGPFALLVNSGPTVVPGTYPLTVTCVSGSLTATKALTLIVTDVPGFRVAVEPNSLLVAQGQTGIANFQLFSENGFAGSVSMNVSGLPSGVSAEFTPSTSVAVPGSGAVNFTVGIGAPPGVYPLQITATDGSVTRSAAFSLTVLQDTGSGSWRQQALSDTPALFYGVIVGDIGNTGQNRVIASGGQGLMYAYSFNGTSWSTSQMPFNDPADGEMHNMAIGSARNDGINRLYIAAVGLGRVYEVSWVNGAWQKSVIATLNGATDMSIGYGRNDTVLRLYVTWMSGTTELTWNGSSWTQLTMSSNEGGWVHGLDLAPGRNDGVNRVYTANQGNGEVYEYSWNGSTWTKLFVGSSSDMRNIKVGEGRNDGLLRLYAAAGDSNVYEYTWNGTSWQGVSIGNAGVGGIKVHSVPGRTKPDNRVRIYAAASNGGVYEYNWTGSAWQTTSMGLATAYMYGLDVGDGLNKSTIQVYGSSYDGNAYLYEWVPGSPGSVTVPNVVGLTEAAARTAITNATLTVGTVTNPGGGGLVTIQSPAAGTLVAPGSAVAFTVGSATVTVPGAPTNVSAVAGNAQATVSFTPPVSNGGAAITSYTVTPYIGTTAQASTIGTGSPVTVTGLTNGTTYTFRVIATNSVGSGPPSDPSNAVTPATVPGAPTNVSAVAGNAQAIVSFTPPASNGGAAITSYTVTPYIGTTAQAPRIGTGSPVTVTGLTNGTTYTFRVTATNIVGSGPASAPSNAVTPTTGVGITVDATVFSDGTGTRRATLTTTGPNRLILAFGSSDGPSSGGQTLTVTGGGLVWTRVRRVNTRLGSSEIWRAYASAALSNARISLTQSRTGFHQSLTVVAFAGATGVGASNGANGASGAPSVTLTTTRAGSLVYGVGNDWDRAVARTVPSGQTKVHEWVDTSVGDTFWVQARIGAVPTAGTAVRLYDTAPTNDRWNFASVEIVQ